MFKKPDNNNKKNIDNALLQNGFIRIHRSHLVNSHFIKRYNENKIGHWELYDGASIKIGRRK